MDNPAQTRRAAFSLLELILTLTVLAGLATGLVVFYFQRSDVTLDNAARLLVEDLRTAQGIALNSGTPTSFAFEGDTYTATDQAGETLMHPRTGVGFVRDYHRDAVFEGVQILSVELDGAAKLQFAPDGTPSTGGTVRLGFAQAQRIVRIEPVNGWISVD